MQIKTDNQQGQKLIGYHFFCIYNQYIYAVVYRGAKHIPRLLIELIIYRSLIIIHAFILKYTILS